MDKQYLVVKIKGDHGAHLNLVPIAGLMPMNLAEQFMLQATEAEPESVFMIQEVGSA